MQYWKLISIKFYNAYWNPSPEPLKILLATYENTFQQFPENIQNITAASNSHKNVDTGLSTKIVKDHGK